MLTAEEVSRLINRSNVTNIADTQFIAYGLEIALRKIRIGLEH